jgi:hypothetical protein
VDDLIRAKIREALEVEQPDAGLRSRVLGSLPTDNAGAPRFGRPSFQWAGGFVAALIAVAVVSGLLYSRGALSLQGPPTSGVPATGARYTVTASLLAVRGQPVYACWFIEDSLPPAGCAGAEVRNVNVAAVPGAVTFQNGTVQTPVVKLVGVWNGKTLTLTELPQSTRSQGAEPKPVSLPPPATSKGSAAQVDEQILHDMLTLQQRGIFVLSIGIGADGVDVVLLVADAASVETLYSQYGRIHISGWLQPA